MFYIIDTIKLKSPFLSSSIVDIIEGECFKRQGINIKTGELVYEITSGSLIGSFDNKISVKVCRLDPERPYIVIEGSVHKALLGHNVYGGPCNFKMSCNFFIKLVERLLGVKLPCYEDWFVLRVDVAECYKLPSFEAVQEWFSGLNASSYPRRAVNRYGLSGLYAQGSTTTLKFYHKGVEFSKHDRPRLKKIFSCDKISFLQSLADKIIRCELEVKIRKFKYDFGFAPLVKNVDNEYLNSLYDLEVARFLKEGVSMMTLVSNAKDVKDRLFSIYKPALAGTLLGTWYQLTTLGECSVKQTMSKPTYYRHLKQLKEAGVSWNCTDVVLEHHSLIPEGFAPIRGNSFRLTDIDSDILDIYKKYDVA